MTLFKSIVYTVFLYLIINIISCWLLIEIPLDFEVLLYFDSFFSPFISLLVLGIYLGLKKDSDFLSVSSSSTKFYVLAALIGIVYVFIQTPLNLIYNALFNTEYLIEYSFKPLRLLHWSSFSSILIVPIYEEFFFRKFIQNDLQKSYHPFLAILFTCTLFASVHLPFHHLVIDGHLFSYHHAYIAFFGGLISGILYYKSKSIGPSIIFHCMWNVGVYLF